MIVLGRVDAVARAEAGVPLLYFSGRYRRLSLEPSPGGPEIGLDFLYHNILSFT